MRNVTSNIFICLLGLSCKTQEIYLIVFCLRYVDLFMYYISLYNTLMKVFFIFSTAFIVYLMRYKKPYCTVSIHFHFIEDNISKKFLLIDLWLNGWWFPSFESIVTSCFSSYLPRSIRMDRMGVDMVIQSLAWSSRFLTINYHA